jgi:aminoglycoside phosphotransferase
MHLDLGGGDGSPSVFVRDLLPEEGNLLKRLSRKAASEAKRERALICWASATKMSAPQIAALVGTDESHVRKGHLGV